MQSTISTTPAPPQRLGIRTLALSALGGTLEYYDFIVYVFFAQAIGTLFFPAHTSDWLRDLQTFGIFAAGYLARPLGGAVFGHFADKLGRKRTFTLTVMLMALPTLLIGCLPTYASIGTAAPLLLLMMRILQGLAVGGELTGAWVFAAEHVPKRHYGLGLGILEGGISGGVLLGSLVAGWIHTHYSAAQIQDYAWRLPFVLGGAFGLVSMYLRRLLEETPVFKALKAQSRGASELPLRTVLREHRPALAYVALQTWILSAGFGVVMLLAPAYLHKLYDTSMAQALHANSLATLAMMVGSVVFGWSTDRFGPRPAMLIGWGGLLVSGYWLLGVPGQGDAMLLRYVVAGFFTGAVTLVPIVCVRAFPAAIRASGISFGYNIAYAVFGGLTPLLVSFLVHLDPVAPAHYVVLACAVGVLSAFAARSGRTGLPAESLAGT